MLTFLFLLRRSEYLFIGAKLHEFALRLGDIRFADAEGASSMPRRAKGVDICLTGVKNNQFGREDWCFQHKTGDAVLCPVRAARWISRQRRRSVLPTLSRR